MRAEHAACSFERCGPPTSLSFGVMRSPTPIDPAKFQASVSAITDRLAQGDYEGLYKSARASRLPATDMERVVREYGRHLVSLPVEAFHAIDVVAVSGTSPQRWSVVVPLWTKEEGRSDLSLALTIEESSASSYAIEIDDLHVL